MAEVAQIYLGNIYQNSELAELIEKEACLEVCLSQSDRSKGRIHAHTDDNIAIGIIKSRDRLLQSGDIFKTEFGKFLLINLREQELLVLDFSAVEGMATSTQLVHLGHVLGNHHHGIAIRDHKIYVQLTTGVKLIEKIITDLQIPGLKITYEAQSSSQEITFTSHSH